MPLVDLIDETFVVAEPAAVAARLRDEALWRRAWPGLDRRVFMDRGDSGIRWTVTGDLVGSCEVWLEPHGDGVIVHYFLRADPTRRGSRTEPATGAEPRLRRLGLRVLRDHTARWKSMINNLKDELEAGRAPGEPPGRIRPNGSSPAPHLPNKGA